MKENHSVEVTQEIDGPWEAWGWYVPTSHSPSSRPFCHVIQVRARNLSEALDRAFEPLTQQAGELMNWYARPRES